MAAPVSKILAFDSAMFGCSAGLLDVETGRCSSRSIAMERGQAEHLVPLIAEIVELGGACFADIDLIVTTVGPGAFTGVRIGLSAARALALALDRPLVGVTTLEVLAAQFFASRSLSSGEALLVLVETKRKDFYGQLFAASGMAVSEPAALEADAFARLAAGYAGTCPVVGDALERFRASLDPDRPGQFTLIDGFTLPDPEIMAKTGLAHYRAGDGSGAGLPVEPLYLRGADVSQQKKPPRVLASDL